MNLFAYGYQAPMPRETFVMLFSGFCLGMLTMYVGWLLSKMPKRFSLRWFMLAITLGCCVVMVAVNTDFFLHWPAPAAPYQKSYVLKLDWRGQPVLYLLYIPGTAVPLFGPQRMWAVDVFGHQLLGDRQPTAPPVLRRAAANL